MNLQKELLYIHLPDNETMVALTEYNQLLLSLINRNVLSITTIGGNTNYLCNSSLEEIMLKNEILSIINSTVIKLPYFSVYAGIIISSMLMKLWHETIEILDLQKMTENLIKFKDILEEALNHLKLSGDNVLNVSSLQHSLMNLLLQEPALMFSAESLNTLSFEIVKGILAKVSVDEGLNIGQIYIHVRNGHEYFSMINGVLCEVDETTSSLIKSLMCKLSVQNKMILFTENMFETDRLMLVLKEMLYYNIKLVLCQRKVSDSLKMIFRRNEIVVVERIGFEVAKSIEQIASCVPVCNINNLEINSILTYVGHFSNIDIKILNGLNYIVIENKGCSVSTLYVSCRSFTNLSYTKKICSQSIKFVYSMIASPYLLPGPITFEEKLSHYLKNKTVSSELMVKIISIFCNVLNGIKAVYKDSKYVNRSSDQSKTDWDCYQVKKNALIHSIDGVINCLSIGMIVRK